ncbi:MAG TPA: c-type cytochrome [Candidatus Eisenbacteria bacterium]|nr:c-type cytochrome [Candidatus Eisenbacteria bacterium]
MTHDPHGSHTPHGHDHEESLSKTLARMQFVVTGIFILVIASLAYVAGMHSAKGGHGGEGEGGGTSAAPASKVDVQALLKDSPEQIAKGKSLFAVNCASCHGNTGQGNGPASAALNPKPRDFTSGYWRYGGGEARVVRTISEGSPGTAMAAFTSIPLEDRFALAHYVRSLGPKEQEDKPEDLAWLGPTGGTSAPGGTPTAGPATPQPSKATMPIEAAIALLAQPEPKVGVSMTASSDTGEPGASLYAERCVSCHGGGGEGGVRVRMIGSAPYAYVTSRSLGDAQGAWTGDAGAFEKLILNGIPGYVMPANGDLSREALQDLRGYTLKLRAFQQGARRPGS